MGQEGKVNSHFCPLVRGKTRKKKYLPILKKKDRCLSLRGKGMGSRRKEEIKGEGEDLLFLKILGKENGKEERTSTPLL